MLPLASGFGSEKDVNARATSAAITTIREETERENDDRTTGLLLFVIAVLPHAHGSL